MAFGNVRDNGVVAQPHAADDPGNVVDDEEGLVHTALQMTRVPPAEVAAVEVREHLEVPERGHDPPAPPARPDPFQRDPAELLVVGPAVAERLVGKLEVRHEHTVVEESRPDPGPERHDELETLAGDDGETLQVGVVRDPGRFAELLGEGPGDVESRPGRDELRVDPRAKAALGHELRFGSIRPFRTTPGRPTDTRS